MAHTILVAGMLPASGDLASEKEVRSMRYAMGLLVVSLSLTALAQSSPQGQTPLQPKDAEVDRNKPVQGNAWSQQAKSPRPADAGTHTGKGKSDGGQP
jgi:hypothetical protein